MKILFEQLNTKKFLAHEILSNMKKEDVKNAISFLIERDDACKKIEQLIDHYTKYYHDCLGEKNFKIPFSVYSYIVRPYLGYIISITYSYFCYLDQKIDDGIIKEYLCCFNNVNDRLFDTSDDFFENVFLNKSFHEWMLFNICIALRQKSHFLTIENKELEIIKSEPKKDKFSVGYNGLKLALISWANRNFYFKNIYGFSIYENAFLSSVFWLRMLFKPFKKKYYSREYREKVLSLEKMDNKFLNVLDKIISVTIPKSFLENIHHLTKNITNTKKSSKSTAEFDAVVPRFFSDNVIQDAYKTDGNHIIFAVQHGAGYATSYRFLSTLTEFLVDKFVFFGKEFPENNTKNCEFLNAPSAFLSRLKNKHSCKNDELIFVGTAINPLQDGILFASPSGFSNYLVLKNDFFNHLRNNVFEKSYYKLYISPVYKDFDEKKFISELFPKLKILDCKYNIDEKIKTSKIFVMDHLEGTTFYKAMAANTPIICYNGYPFFEFYPKAKKIYDEFKKVNIIFDDPKSAADFINTQWTSINDWWSSENVQMVRKEFCDLYAQTSKFYLLKWAQMIVRM